MAGRDSLPEVVALIGDSLYRAVDRAQRILVSER